MASDPGLDAERAQEEIDIRLGLTEPDGERHFKALSDDDLILLASYDPDPEDEADQALGIQLLPTPRRRTSRKRLQEEPEGPALEDTAPIEEEKAEKPKRVRPSRARTTTTAPKRVQARVSLGSGLGWTVGGAGYLLVVSNRDQPVGRALQLESPIAGQKLDALIANTWLDRMLQPLARAGGVAKEAGAVLALPMLVGILERRPELWPVLEPFARAAVTEIALGLAEMQEHTAERMREAEKRAGGKTVDVDGLMAMIFQGSAPQPQNAEPAAAPV